MQRRALLVGINHYPDPANRLRGCLNDVLQTSQALQQHYHFEGARDIRVLADQRATTAAIRGRLEWLVDGARPGDVLVFHYSGHGSQVRDRHGDELDDGLDEIICPYDLDWDNPFTDDDLGALVSAVEPGVSLTVVLDCCHSGTGLRACGPDRARCLIPPVDIRHREQPAIEDLGPSRRQTLTAPPIGLPVRRIGRGASAKGAVLIAACRADQSSADAWIDHDYHGALTYYLWRALADAGYAATYADTVARLAGLLANGGYEQVPQLEGDAWLLRQPAFTPLVVETA
jgi:hypothetical protein